MQVNKRFIISIVCGVCCVNLIIVINYHINVPAIGMPTILYCDRIPRRPVIDTVSNLVISPVDMDDMNMSI